MTAIIIQFPRRDEIRIERERDGEGWMVVTPGREHGWTHSDFNSATFDAREIAAGFGVSIRSSALER
jgi:hypothetical protein